MNAPAWTEWHRPHVHVCSLCYREWATWSPEVLPKEWDRIDINRVRCRKCRKAQRRAA